MWKCAINHAIHVSSFLVLEGDMGKEVENLMDTYDFVLNEIIYVFSY